MKPVATLQDVFQGAVLAGDRAPGLFVREGLNEDNKNNNQSGLFDKQERMTKLSTLCDPLVSSEQTINFEKFSSILEDATNIGVILVIENH